MSNDAADLPDLLAGAGIKLKSLRPDHNEKVRCPKCDGGRTRETSLSVSIDADGAGAKWKCHRGQCGWASGGRVRGPDGHRRMAPAQRQQDVAIVRPQEHQAKAKPKALYAFFDARGISEDTVDHFGVYIAPHWFPETGPHPAKEYPAIVFPYRYRGELVNRKYRPPHKNPQMQDKNALPTLFNVDALADCPDDGWVCFCEGEPDCLALHEAGWPYAVTLKDGAPNTIRDEDDAQRQDDKRFAALGTHEEELQRFQRIVLAVDDDVPGRNLREELARRLGRHRCYTVEWPEGCKDAGDVLKQHGRDKLTECIGRAEPWPIEGVQRIKPGMLQALRREPPPPVLTTGTKATDGIMRLPGEGKLIVVTGVPGHGKTTWVRYVMVHTAINHGRRWLCFSPENAPWQRFLAECAEVFTGRPFNRRRVEGEWVEPMSDDELAHAEEWLSPRIEMLAADSLDVSPTLEWVLDRAKTCVMRNGTTDLLIDPWNELEHMRPEKMSETEYVGWALHLLRAFNVRHGINTWVIAHPKVQLAPKVGGKLLAPGLYDISGGANWANKCDLGISVHTPETDTEIHLIKSKFRRWGTRGTKATIQFDKIANRYYSPATLLDLVERDETGGPDR